MLIGTERLLEDYGSAANIAEAMIEGRCSSEYASYVVDDTILKAAKMRIELRRDLAEKLRGMSTKELHKLFKEAGFKNYGKVVAR